MSCTRLRDEEQRRKSKARPNRNEGTTNPKSMPEWRKTATCHGCGEIGHIKPNCHNKNKTDGDTGEGDSPVPVSSAQIKELTSRMEKKGRNAGYIATVCGAIPALLDQRDQVCGTRPQHEGVGLINSTTLQLQASKAVTREQSNSQSAQSA